MKIVIILILRKNDFFSVNRELRSTDTVAASSDNGSEKASVHLILLNVIIAKHYIYKPAVLIRNNHLHKDGTVIHNLCISARLILKMIESNLLAGG